jgi:hypothetical protein
MGADHSAAADVDGRAAPGSDVEVVNAGADGDDVDDGVDGSDLVEVDFIDGNIVNLCFRVAE